MTKEDLKKFCVDDPYRGNISKLWSFGVHSYATDGSVLIQVPRLDDVEENPTAPDVTSLLLTPKPTTYFPVKDLVLPGLKWCSECKGQGRNVDCPECHGDGEVELETDYNSYSCECKTCYGRAKVDKCEECEGMGKVEDKSPVDVGNAAFQPRLLRLLQSLPDCEIGPTGPQPPAWFKFDGGDGLIMPMRKRQGGNLDRRNNS